MGPSPPPRPPNMEVPAGGVEFIQYCIIYSYHYIHILLNHFFNEVNTFSFNCPMAPQIIVMQVCNISHYCMVKIYCHINRCEASVQHSPPQRLRVIDPLRVFSLVLMVLVLRPCHIPGDHKLSLTKTIKTMRVLEASAEESEVCNIFRYCTLTNIARL